MSKGTDEASGESVSTRIGPEVIIERMILLNDKDEML